MALSTQPYKGARDFYPEDKRLQKYLFGKMREVCERYGYEEYDAPILEPTDLFLSKGNEEIIAEQTYTFTDRGDRSITIRTEMTPSVSRMVAGKRQELAYPLRWYSIPNLWRYERPQKGRLREFWQLNVDIFGLPGIEADSEIITVADAIMKSYGAKSDMYTIKINSRVYMDYILGDYIGLDDVQRASFSRLIDRMHKMDRADFLAQADALCSPSQREEGTVEKLLDVLSAERFTALPQGVQEQPALANVKQLLELLEAGGITNAVFDVTLMRGFDYYTDIIFEINDNDPDNNRAMFGGGRYDGLVGLFGVEPVPTVGFGMGDVTLTEFLKGHNLLPQLSSEVKLYIALTDKNLFARAQKPISELREMGVNVAVGNANKRLGDQLKAADKGGIHYALVLGENELTEEQYTLKDLVTGTEEKHSLQRIVSIVRDRRNQDDE